MSKFIKIEKNDHYIATNHICKWIVYGHSNNESAEVRFTLDNGNLIVLDIGKYDSKEVIEQIVNEALFSSKDLFIIPFDQDNY